MAGAFSESMDNFSAMDKQILVERHLISREHAAKGVGSGLVLNREESLCVMINEEDHLRMQALRPGLQLRSAWLAIDQVDTALERRLDYAFSNELGYLTACPTNIGTGIRVSAMLHLPALVLAEQINQIIQAVNKLGLAVRGLYGEGTEALGNVFQVSNQMTLGEAETDIVERLNKVLTQLIEHEENARTNLLEKKPKMVFNHIGRAYGILANAHSISSKETMNLLSLTRLGIDLGMFPGGERSLVDELLILSPPTCRSNTPKNCPLKSGICSGPICCGTVCARSAVRWCRSGRTGQDRTSRLLPRHAGRGWSAECPLARQVQSRSHGRNPRVFEFFECIFQAKRLWLAPESTMLKTGMDFAQIVSETVLNARTMVAGESAGQIRSAKAC